MVCDGDVLTERIVNTADSYGNYLFLKALWFLFFNFKGQGKNNKFFIIIFKFKNKLFYVA